MRLISLHAPTLNPSRDHHKPRILRKQTVTASQGWADRHPPISIYLSTISKPRLASTSPQPSTHSRCLAATRPSFHQVYDKHNFARYTRCIWLPCTLTLWLLLSLRHLLQFPPHLLCKPLTSNHGISRRANTLHRHPPLALP